MNERFLSLGNVVIFSIILPGFILLVIHCQLNPELHEASNFILSVKALAFGFAANIFGHLTGVIHRNIKKKYQGVPFETVYHFSYKMPIERAILIRQDSKFWFSIYCLYWNTGWGLILVGILNIAKIKSHWYIFILVAIGFIMLWYLSEKVLEGIIAISNVAGNLKSVPVK